MARATTETGQLQALTKCRIVTPWNVIYLKVLPELTVNKGASYQNETIPGRASPLPTYSHSDAKTISSELTFIVTTCQDITDNLTYLRTLESLVYPGNAGGGSPFTPPPICKFICGRLLGDNGVCVVLKTFSFKPGTDVPWDVESYLPYKLVISCQWEVVYACSQLPTNNMIREIGGTVVCPPRHTDLSPDY